MLTFPVPYKKLSGAYGSLLSESTRLEHMVLDIRRYIEMLNSEPELCILPLEDLIKSALAALRAETHYVEVKVDLDLDPRCAFVELQIIQGQDSASP